MELKLSKGQQEFIDLVQSGENIFLSGKAGVGKSFITKHAIELLEDMGKKVIAVAPTGVAANNVGGQTIHSLFSLNPYGVLDYEACNYFRGDKKRLLKAVDVIFIDEVSMLRPDILDGMHWTLVKNGCGGLDSKQVVFIGDMKQLPPVLNGNTKTVLYETYDGETFEYSQIYRELNVAKIELGEILRQSNPEFIKALNLCREGKKSEYFRQFSSTKPNGGIILAPHNATVAQYNQKGLESLDGPEYMFQAEIEGNIKADDFNLEAEVRVKNGAKVMYLANSKEFPLVNGTLGEFTSHNGMYFICVDGVNYPLEPIKFAKKEYVMPLLGNKLVLKEVGSIEQIPIKLAYALSIHRSQGLTFDEVTIDLRRPCFMPGQLYVALSRVRTPEGLCILI